MPNDADVPQLQTFPVAPVERRPRTVFGLFSAIVGFLTAFSCFQAAGVSLGLFFGPVIILTALVPFFASGRVSDALGNVVTMTAGVALVWILEAHLSVWDLCRCTVTLGAYLGALAGIVRLLQAVGMDPVFSSAAVAIGASAWLLWPIWLCPWLDGPHAEATVRILTSCHPMLALNGTLFSRFNFWDRFPLAYQQLTTLNQDILYSLPKSIAGALLLHFGIAGSTFGLTEFLLNRRSPVAT